MPIARETLIREFGGLTVSGRTSVLVGAGLSRDAGLPDWATLMRSPRREANVPAAIKDLPLLADYYTQVVAGGEDRLVAHAIELTAKAGLQIQPRKNHELLARLGVAETWTTNYDDLIERAVGATTGVSPVVIARESDLVDLRDLPGRRVIKMHGGLVAKSDGSHVIAKPVVITRRHFETYSTTHPRMWSLLQSSFLTRSILFLGFSFDDPNIEVLLRLARSIDSPRLHYAVMRRPPSGTDLRLHQLRVTDLENSGILVNEVEQYTEIQDVLEQLVRRTQPPNLFVSGNRSAGGAVLRDLPAAYRQIGARLAELDLTLHSLGGQAAGVLSNGFAQILRQRGLQNAGERIRFFFGQPQPGKTYNAEVVGTHIFTQLSSDDRRRLAMEGCRAMLVMGGTSGRSANELTLARAAGIPVIPVAATGGTAQDYWKRTPVAASGIPIPASRTDEAELHWEALGDPDINSVTAAVRQLVEWATYLG